MHKPGVAICCCLQLKQALPQLLYWSLKDP